MKSYFSLTTLMRRKCSKESKDIVVTEHILICLEKCENCQELKFDECENCGEYYCFRCAKYDFCEECENNFTLK